MGDRGSISDLYDSLTWVLAKHLVPILLNLEKGTESRNPVITAFVLSVRERWFLVTAGHWLRDIEQLTDSGYGITRCRFLDSLGSDARDNTQNPCIWEDLSWEWVYDGIMDYGVVQLSPYYRGLFERNGIQALSEDVWRAQPPDADLCFYLLLGVPTQLVDVRTEGTKLAVTTNLVQPVVERPEIFQETDIPLFYGRVALVGGVSSIEGMSGGPIFALRQTEEGIRYWLVALQSRWGSESHYVAACPTRLLGRAIEKRLLESEF